MALGKWGKYQCNSTPVYVSCPVCWGTGSVNTTCRDCGRWFRSAGLVGSGGTACYFCGSTNTAGGGSGCHDAQGCNATGKKYQSTTYSRGAYIAAVTAAPGTYPSSGRHTDGYWYVYQGLIAPNAPPTLTVPAVITGGKVSTISWGVATSDGAAIGGYELHRSLNNGTFARIYRGTALTYADTVPYGTNTVQYSVRAYDVDNQLSPFTTGEVRTVVNNNPPVITCTDTDKGEIAEGFTIHYSVTDEDAADTITVTEAIDGVKLRSFAATRATDYTADVTGVTWLKLLNGAHKLTITAVDNRGGTAVHTVNFAKSVHVIEFELSQPLLCDAAATKAITQMLAAIPPGAAVQIYACNNGFDAAPTWVDVTTKVQNGDKIFFENTVKTADKWGYNVRVRIDRNGATGDCYITSIGGNFE